MRKMCEFAEPASSLDWLLDQLGKTDPHLLYFFCHGGETPAGVPYLQLGDPNVPHNEPVTSTSLRGSAKWSALRPLVLMNGCNTAALEPEQAFDFVTLFVRGNRAAGVIGTEITIFESLAIDFAQECLRRYLQERQTIGEAVRGARLKLLAAGNPLGLVYVPFVQAGLKLQTA